MRLLGCIRCISTVLLWRLNRTAALADTLSTVNLARGGSLVRGEILCLGLGLLWSGEWGSDRAVCESARTAVLAAAPAMEFAWPCLDGCRPCTTRQVVSKMCTRGGVPVTH